MLACTPADSHANFPEELDRGFDQSPSVDVLAMLVAADGASLDIVEAVEVVKAARNNISRVWQQCTFAMYLTRQLVQPMYMEVLARASRPTFQPHQPLG
jgi:hypothetical protein